MSRPFPRLPEIPMVSVLSRRLAALGAAVALTASPLLVPSAAEAAPLKCRASMSDATPKQYTDVFVRVKTAPRAKVVTVAHYKTTKTKKRRTANAQGRARVKYYISGATPGYRVRVSVTVSKKGRSRTCSTSFTPHK
jgi:hypothetical protein